MHALLALPRNTVITRPWKSQCKFRADAENIPKTKIRPICKVRRMTSLWTPELRRDFHEAVETLYAITANPSEEKDYRGLLPDKPSTKYALRLKDELQLADHVAFLAHSQEGVHAISAACVEEGDNGLVIRLASNSTPSANTVLGLTKILNTLSNGACEGRTLSVTALSRRTLTCSQTLQEPQVLSWSIVYLKV